MATDIFLFKASLACYRGNKLNLRIAAVHKFCLFCHLCLKPATESLRNYHDRCAPLPLHTSALNSFPICFSWILVEKLNILLIMETHAELSKPENMWEWFSKTKQTKSVMQVIKKMGQYLKMDISVPNEYIEGFTKANNTFLYQLVFDPLRRKVVPLNPYPDHIDPASLSYAGTYLLCWSYIFT